MKQFNYIYTRLALCLLMLMVSSVSVMGQNEGKLPIQSFTSWPNANEGYSLNNLKDLNTSTTWNATRGDAFNIKEYMQISNPYNESNVKRSWVEIGNYVPNQNTEIEVVFEATNEDLTSGLTHHIFGCGLARWGSGMCFGIVNGQYVFKTSNKAHEKLGTATSGKHTAICSATSVKIDGVELMPGTIDPSDRSGDVDVITESGSATGQHYLAFFCSPQDGQEWARNFNGKIYSIKIRENGKLLYDLLPATGWGRSGFYDRISAGIFGFFDMVDYVKNDNITNDANLHIHYKIPYTMGNGTKQSYSWSSNLVANGNLGSDDLSGFTFVPNNYKERISEESGNTVVHIINDGNLGSNPWNCQFSVFFNDGRYLVEGDKYKLSFWCKADKKAKYEAQFQFNKSGGYYGWINIPSEYEYIDTEWKQIVLEGTVGSPSTAAGTENVHAFGLNFNSLFDDSNNPIPNVYYVRNFEINRVTDTGDGGSYQQPTTDNGDLKNSSSYRISTDGYFDRLSNVDGRRAITVKNDGRNGSNAWDCQFRANLSEELNEGDKYYISYFIKAKNSATIGVQLQQTGGGYYSTLPNVEVTTSWQKVVQAGVVGQHDGSVKALGLLLNANTSPNLYYISDVVVTKGTPSGTVPDTEVEITYKNTRTDTDYNSKRHLFSYGTFEDKVLSMNVLLDKYNYTSGGVAGDVGINPKNQKITTKFRPMEIELEDGRTYGISGEPTWNTTVNNFYLFGTHSTNNVGDARSFIGEIYGAVIRENGEVKVNLVPAFNNGTYGFYDLVTKTFYAKDAEDKDRCGTSANFTGASTPDHGGSIATVETYNPFSVTINMESAKIAKNFYLTTSNDNNIATNPRKWSLFGSTDGSNWTPLYEYECLMPKFSEMKTDGTVQYLYNVETGMFLKGGSTWGTHAILSTDATGASQVKVEINGDKYKIKNYVTTSANNSQNNQWHYLFEETNHNVFIDYQSSGNSEWIITSLGNDLYTLSTDGSNNMGAQGNFNTSTELLTGSTAVHTTWAFVNESDYNDYISKKSSASITTPMQNGTEYKYQINNDNAAYSQYRYVIESLVAGNTVNLAELAFTTYYKFEHYEGRVYDTSETIPDNLAVGGSSGYTNKWKTSTDDSRLKAGVQLQRTHEYEHEIYVLPGQTVDLTPFADFASTSTGYNYRDQYIRWYDYKNDTHSTRLSFDPLDGRDENVTTKGDFTWHLRNLNNNIYVRTREASIAHYTADSNPSSGSDGVIDIIAIEASNNFDEATMVWDNDAYKIVEPTLTWRHTFVIKDAKKRADEMFASSSANSTYIQNHKIKLMCPAGTPFQYPLPSYEDKEKTTGTHPTNFYYQDSEGNYVPVYHYSIETTKDGTYLGATNLNFQNVAVTGREDEMAISYKPIGDYNRVFYIKNPQVGKYTIRIHAMKSDNTGGARDARMGENTLTLAEYELEVLPADKALMVNADELKSTSFTHVHQRPDNLVKAFGEPTTVIDFDEVEESETQTDASGNRYYKWPWAWENSSYGFGYENRGDYNMYMVADNSDITPYRTCSNVRDRLYYDTNGSKKGYFFYANAASDPSRMATLNIGKDFCANTRVYVSAWVNEFQGNNSFAETANVIFSFRGVDQNGTETVLNSFVSGYVSGGWNTPTGYNRGTSTTKDSEGNDVTTYNFVNATTNPDNRGKWMHVYYTFTTTQNDANFDHYIITLENNCTSSEGADYAIDDIRAFVCKPQVKGAQLKPVCNGDPATDLKIYGQFELLLDAFGLNEVTGDGTGSNVSFDYCFLDRNIYDNTLKNYYNSSTSINKTTYPTFNEWRTNVSKTDESFLTAYNAAFEAALIKNSYGTGKERYGTFTMNTNYSSNSVYAPDATSPSYYTAHQQQVGTIRNIVFPSNAKDTKMKVGSKYIIAMIKGHETTRTADAFGLEDKCNSVSDFEVTFSGEVKIDGTLRSDLEGVSFCSNQRPTVEIDLNGIAEGGIPVKTENAYFDWYYGPNTHKDGYTSLSEEQLTAENTLSVVLGYFRDKHPTVDGSGLATAETDATFTEDMKNYLVQLVNAGKLSLYTKQEYLSTAVLYQEVKDPSTPKKFYITAIPIRPADVDASVKYCLDAIEVSINLNLHVPTLKDGDDQGAIPYPTTMRDVPLRIGLKQLKQSVIADLNATSSTIQLWIPLREVTPSTRGTALNVTKLQKTEDDLVYLLDSNDPAVLAGTSGAINIETAGVAAYSSIISNLKVIGKVMAIAADKGKHGFRFDTPTAADNGNIGKIAFIEGFKFREGYWYTVQFHFEENYTGISGDHSDVCPGDVIFTIKVVPEYQMWTGAVSRNWNDDGNWKRVSSADLLWNEGKKTSDFLIANAEFITDGKDAENALVNDNTNSFAPADFTKVIIPAGTRYTPYMYEMRDATNLVDVNFTGAPSRTNYLKKTAADRANFDGDKNQEIGLTTDLVKFDMASVVRGDGNIACRTWYDHTCDQIHFNAGAEIMDQRYLYYNKAWCDIDVPVGTWQTVSSPLMNIVAGDLYLPTATARQETPLFEDITYQTTLNDRFKPAVYQRSWNKGAKATVYKLDGSSVSNVNVGVDLDWSHVYNDVNELYGAGKGFSIKVDVSSMGGTKPTVARFRFPKADTQYTYYNPGNADGDKKTETVVDGNLTADGSQIDYASQSAKRPGKLSDLSGTFEQVVGGDANQNSNTSYFLVGNPLMCYLDMSKFFAENSQFEKKYWVVTADGQRTAVFDDKTSGFVSTVTDANTLAPGVSFFVKLANGGDKLVTPQFTKEMMVYLPGETHEETESGKDPGIGENATKDNNDPDYPNESNQNPNGDPSNGARETRSATAESSNAVIPQLRLTTEDNDGRKSIALLTDGTVAKHDMVETLFDSNLRDEVFLYTTKAGQAQTIASIEPGDTLPLVTAGVHDEVMLHIEGADKFDYPLYVIDSEMGTTELLGDEAHLPCSANGVRYYITSPKDNEMEMECTNVPRVTARNSKITVFAPADAVIASSCIYTTGGICVDRAEDVEVSHEVALRPDVYIVQLIVEGKKYTYKLLLTE